ncbi:MAG: hypothetical protein IPH56_01095 [Chitinophagaceae bacterium]|nr:hypothetical protein [Chitinophagaceae bacterium]
MEDGNLDRPFIATIRLSKYVGYDYHTDKAQQLCVFSKQPGKPTSQDKAQERAVLENLPYHFNRQTYVATALSLGITDKSAQRYIKEFKDADIIQHDGHDQYTNPNAKNPQ